MLDQDLQTVGEVLTSTTGITANNIDSNHESEKVFADLTQHFANGWQLRVNDTHAQTDFDSKLMYADGFPDKDTGEGVFAYGGWNKGKRKLDSVDTYATGHFELLGRQHELVAGAGVNWQNHTGQDAYGQPVPLRNIKSSPL